MASLTIAKRASVVESESTKKFYKTLQVSEKELRDLIEEIAKASVPKWLTEEVEKSGWLNTSSYFELDGNCSYLNNLGIAADNLYNQYPCPHNSSEIQLKATKALKDLSKRRKILLKEKKNFEIDLRAVLNAYTTVKKLLVAVPELEEYFTDVFTSTALVPIEHIERVRKSLQVSKK